MKILKFLSQFIVELIYLILTWFVLYVQIVLCTLQYKMRLMSLILGSHYTILHTAVCTSTIKSLKTCFFFSCWLTPAKSNWSRVQEWRSTYRKNLQGKCDTLFLVLQTELGVILNTFPFLQKILRSLV